MQGKQPENYDKTASEQQVQDWMVKANHMLDSKESLVAKSFKVCKISNALDSFDNSSIHKQLWRACRAHNYFREQWKMLHLFVVPTTPLGTFKCSTPVLHAAFTLKINGINYHGLVQE